MRRYCKQAVTLATVVALGVSMLNGANVAQAKKQKPKMSKKMTMTVSQTKKLKVKKLKKSKIKKTTWKVSSKKKLSLSKKKKDMVTVKAKKKGTVKVTAIIKMKSGKKYKLSTKVKIKAKQANPDSVPEKTAPAGQTNVPVTTAPVATPTGNTAISTVPPTIAPTKAPIMDATAKKEEAAAQMKIMEKLPAADTYEKTVAAPALMTMLDGTEVTTKEQWGARREEIKSILQRYMYGIWRNGADEQVTYTASEDELEIVIKRGDAESEFTATVEIPEGTAPEGGWPVLVSVGGFSNSYVGASGYATITFDPNHVASDNTNRSGAFYELYPYSTSDWKEQTGTVMAWAWGASKILDALQNGAGAQLNISTENTIVTGVSRYGKAAAAAGAFEERFKVSMPVCSGYGGMTMARYNSNNLTYNLLPEFENDPKVDDVADLAAWKSSGGNEPINSLQGAGWFNETYKGFASYQNLPFDAHYIAALSAKDDHYMFIVTGINSDMWSSPPGFWWCYQEAKPAFTLMGLEDNLAIQMHLNLHGIETVDLCKLFTFTEQHFYGKTLDATDYPAPWDEILANFTLDDLKTCIFASEANQEAYMAGMPVDPSTLPPNPDNEVSVDVSFGDEKVATTVKRSATSDGLVSELTGDEAGTGFSYQYGPEMQYGESYVRFDLKLPEGKKLSDYSSVSFVCQTDGNYYGKKMALVANPKTTGLPNEIEYDYDSGATSNAVNLSGGQDFPNNTSTARALSLNIDNTLAQQLDGQEVEMSIYIHMECGEGDAQYTIRDISFNE